MRNRGGFTLVELMIVIAIIMVLAGAMVARMSTSGETARQGKAKAELEHIAAACRSFYADTGLWPPRIADLVTNVVPPNGYNENFAAVAIPAGTFKGPYMEVETIGQVLNDPWAQPYVLTYVGLPDGKWGLYATCGASHATTRIFVHRFS